MRNLRNVLDRLAGRMESYSALLKGSKELLTSTLLYPSTSGHINNMKLGATITSERGRPVTKTGNEYMTIAISDDNREVIAILHVYPYRDDVGDGYKADITFADHVYGKAIGEHIDIKNNGNLKHGK